MAKITFGKQSGPSRFVMDVLTHGSSSTEIVVGDQTEQSVRDVHVTDLPENIDMAALAVELARLRLAVARQPVGSTATENLKQAEDAARAGDRAGTSGYLRKAGTWCLDLAKTIGSDVAVAALKASLGLS